ncbi:RhoGAP-domain-containing protein [Laetiporus sulphureus 93-53]|uniref:RhoGAP-domain-containing protein n=1 Tax=Laetiporus sulphureus 93-53 TaxID=1314785 RepID=A0A165GAG8_9APHY|nr:RhoGAP-domain-containing protein [Laetiporus sulphureus 93-53]KZT10069.1 RhoGAP-domain-containing protein [Laetiporus sulphureus 93-53]
MSGPADQGRQFQGGSQPSGDPAAPAYMDLDSESYEQLAASQNNSGLPPSPLSRSHSPDRSKPHRASTVSSPHNQDQRRPRGDDHLHAHSEDLNHYSSRTPDDVAASDQPSSRSQTLLTASRPTTPSSSSNNASSEHSHSSKPRRGSIHSDSSLHSDSSIPDGSAPVGTSTTHTSASVASTPCSACGKAMQGAFVRALGTVYHLQCFKCMDCGTVVASKFFPIDASDGKQHPLCERDYFRRLNLICAKCGMALRGSYITACNKKYHVEHFTCSVCPTLFGPQDSYYEHDGDVFCHYHYSTRFATKCAGCNSAILKQFVEINRNMRDECWHPECYMINKFWNVKVVARRPALPPSTEDVDAKPEEPPWAEEERRETSDSLRNKQIRMEQQVYRIWTVLSAFEESSAACISDMLRQVSNGQYLEAIRMAEKFILHVEVLFATIDDLEWHFSRLKLKGMSHVREARMLCRKTVDLFTLLSHTQETGARRMGMTQELLALVTGLAHYLKILIRIALTGALKLEREQNVQEAITSFLDKLHVLAIQGGNPSAKRMMKRANGEVVTPTESGNIGTQGVTYGFKSLAPENAGESPFASSRDPVLAKVNVVNPPSDLCVKCNQTVEEDCVRLGTYQRWHSQCVQCATCGKVAAAPVPKEPPPPRSPEDQDKEEKPLKLSTARRPPANAGLFVFQVDSMKETASFGVVPTVIFCTEHGHGGCRTGFQAVSRLEQYAFLLNVALRRLYVLLKKRGVVQLAPAPLSSQNLRLREDDPYRNSSEINRLKSVHLDRKLSATARVPRRSTVVESPTGRVAQAADAMQGQRPQELVHTHSFRATPQGQTSSANKLHKSPHSHHRNPPGTIDTNTQTQVIRPPFARNNTGIMIVDDSAPTSPAGMDESLVPGIEDGITLADIPQLFEAAQAREQHRSLPRQSSIPFIAELSTLQLAIVKHCAVLVLQRSPLRDQFDLDEILELVEIKKSSFWKQLFKPGNDKKNVKKKGVFGVPLELLVEREGADSMLGASRASIKIPSFVDDVVSAMRQMDMSIEGIFRRNGNIRRLKELTDAIDRDPSSVDLTQDNPVQLAALLKKFFRDLPDPLMTFKLHRLFIASQSLPTEAERMRMLHMVSLILPKAHRDTLEVLFVFLKWVASFAHLDTETGSKMDLPNLATVICPSILYARGRDAVRDESLRAIRVVTTLLERQDEFYCVPQEFLPILKDQEYFANSLDLPSKDFLKKCDTYMRLKASGRTPVLTSPVSGASPFTPGTPRPEDSRALPPRAQSNPQHMDRPPIPNPTSSDGNLRNGHPQPRHQGSAPPLQHAPFSYPAPSPPNLSPQLASAPAPSMSQGSLALHAPQPRAPNVQANEEWAPPERQPFVGQVPSRPASMANLNANVNAGAFAPVPVAPRNSGDGPHPFGAIPNGHAQPAVRQRT